MGDNWRDCIVVLIDLVDVKKLTKMGAASQLMRDFHRLTIEQKPTLASIAHAYVWNDSVLLLSYVDGSTASFQAAMRDADQLKRRVNRLNRSYAIAVKGQVFPPTEIALTGSTPGVTVIRASSGALANCFEVEGNLRALRKSWYVDTRIWRKLFLSKTATRRMVKLLPSRKPRTIYAVKGYLWGED